MNRADYLALVRSLPCACCGAPAPSSAHHPRIGQGMAQKSGDYTAIPLCWECHQGKHGWHGDRSRAKLRGLDEMRMLDATIAQVLRLLSAGQVGIRGEPAEIDTGSVGVPGTQGGCEARYLGEAWLRAAKHDWARFTLHPEGMKDGNPFEGFGVPSRYMLAAIPLPDEA